MFADDLSRYDETRPKLAPPIKRVCVCVCVCLPHCQGEEMSWRREGREGRANPLEKVGGYSFFLQELGTRCTTKSLLSYAITFSGNYFR